MALDLTNLTRISAGPAQTWMYHSTDAIATIVAADYFLDPGLASQTGVTGEKPNIRPNDVIIAVGTTGGTRTVDVLVVATSTSTAITTINGT